MLAELAAANAAFAVIKQCVQNGQDIAKAGKAIGSFVSAKVELQREGNKKRARGVGGSDGPECGGIMSVSAKRPGMAVLPQQRLLHGARQSCKRR